MLNALRDKEGFGLLSGTALLAGLTYWQIPYADVNFFASSFLLTWGIMALLGGFLGVLFLRKSVFQAVQLVVTGFLIAVILRIIVDGISDPTSHNLFPFELIITFAIATPPALVGSWIANFLIRKD